MDTVVRKVSSNQVNEITLKKLMAESFGAEILAETDFSELCNKLLTVVSSIVKRKQYTLADKIIVENSMALWIGCVLYNPELFNEFIQWNSKNLDTPENNFVLSGLLFCPEEKIRMDFQNTFASLSLHFSSGENSALSYFLGVVAGNFS